MEKLRRRKAFLRSISDLIQEEMVAIDDVIEHSNAAPFQFRAFNDDVWPQHDANSLKVKGIISFALRCGKIEALECILNVSEKNK